jgi:hypothetical protein
MAKKQPKEKTPPALELKDILASIDLGAKDLWDQFTDEQKKCVNFFTLNRFVSSVGGSASREVQEHFVLAVNEYYNKNYFSVSKHPKLLWVLLCECALKNKRIVFHEYIRLKTNETKKLEFLKLLFPNRKTVDLELLAEINSDKELRELGQNHGLTDKEIEKYI